MTGEWLRVYQIGITVSALLYFLVVGLAWARSVKRYWVNEREIQRRDYEERQKSEREKEQEKRRDDNG